MRVRQASIAVILITVFIDMVGIGIVFPIMPKLIQSMLGGDVAGASTFYGVLVGLYYLMNFLASPALGGLADAIGRRPVILASLAALGVDYVILALAPNLWWLAVGRVVAGVLGATYTAASAYMADISPPEKRAQNFGLIGAAFGVGFIAGPVIGGLLGEIGPRLPFVAAACLSLANCLFGFFVLPESLKLENRRPFRLSDANPIGAFVKVGAYPAVASLIVVAILANLAERALESTWVLFSSYQFHWGPFEVGVSLAAVGVLIALVQGGLIRIIVPRLGERRTLHGRACRRCDQLPALRLRHTGLDGLRDHGFPHRRLGVLRPGDPGACLARRARQRAGAGAGRADGDRHGDRDRWSAGRGGTVRLFHRP